MKEILKKIVKCFFPYFKAYDLQAQKAGVKIGEDNEIMCKFWVQAEPYLISIGNNCQITKGVKFFTHGGCKVARFLYPRFDCFGKIIVGSNVYIGNNSLIMPGVVIGNNVLIAAGSVVCKSVPDNMVVGGNPAKIIGSLDDFINRNNQYNVDTKGLTTKQKKEFLLHLDDRYFIKKKYMIDCSCEKIC